MIKEKLKRAPVHNLGEERSVGFVNYELSLRGERFLESASKKMVINKSIDCFNEKNAQNIFSYRDPSLAIQGIKTEWKNNINVHRNEVYSTKEKSRLSCESKKYALLEKLKNDRFPGPFTKPVILKSIFPKILMKGKRISACMRR